MGPKNEISDDTQGLTLETWAESLCRENEEEDSPGREIA